MNPEGKTDVPAPDVPAPDVPAPDVPAPEVPATDAPPIAGHAIPATIDAPAYLAVACEVFDGIDAVLATLDDEAVNATPLPGTVNPVFALMRHLHGMAGFWGGSIIAGEKNPRDRAAEFRAHGTVAEAAALLADLRARLPGWVDVAAAEGIRDPHATGTSRTDAAEVSAAWVLQHILHECAQHLGHMEICRDLVLAD